MNRLFLERQKGFRPQAELPSGPAQGVFGGAAEPQNRDIFVRSRTASPYPDGGVEPRFEGIPAQPGGGC
jgi:hypothetical protein